MTVRLLIGDCREVLKTLPDCSIQMCVTSPPYFGLRDYGVSGQLGLEKTPDEYVANMVAVFREVRRALRDDGTLWLNLGDSYAGSWKNQGRKETRGTQRPINGPMMQSFNGHPAPDSNAGVVPDGLKPKDLVGIPWRVAFALQQPYYAGTIRDERDRVWLAAMLDAEGCIYIHRRKEGQNNGQGYARKNDTFGVGMEVSNTHAAIVERCLSLTGVGSIIRQDKDRRQPLYRWMVRTTEARNLIRELYPHLIAKQHQARIGYGCPSSGERATAAWDALKLMHGGSTTTVDFPPPPSMYEPGWYLRSDVIWSKPNPMPESVTDRPTKAHEYLFLLTKSASYFYDADAIKEQSVEPPQVRDRASRMGGKWREVKTGGDGAPLIHMDGTRNRRSVWTIATLPYKGAHFATFPPKLIEPCILAGTSPQSCEHCAAPWERVTEKSGGMPVDEHPDDQGRMKASGEIATDTARRKQLSGARHAAWKAANPDRHIGYRPTCDCADNTGAARCVVLDPFGGAGTTGLVADRLGRDAILIELNPEYASLGNDRITDDAPLFADVNVGNGAA